MTSKESVPFGGTCEKGNAELWKMKAYSGARQVAVSANSIVNAKGPLLVEEGFRGCETGKGKTENRKQNQDDLDFVH